MTDTMRALRAFLTQTGLPVYLEGQIPDGAAFPYAAYSLTAGGFGEPVPARVTGWYRGPGANGEAAAFLDRLTALIPGGGARLTLPSGLMTLHLNERSAVTDGDAVGGRALLEARLYALPPTISKEG